ncbi:hypothetical protein B566_EDAN002735 [Ephemera danica]|nr:hypothetical protein B566_EDAN002735 [Ephemera danica]
MGLLELETALRVTLNNQKARNAVLFVGDGMGPTSVTAARIFRGQHDAGQGKSAEAGLLAFERFPHVALLKTYSVDKQVPDSACSATALFCGVKSNYETAGVDANVALGDCFVTTSRVTHATPSALYAHVANRKWECEAKMPSSAAAKCKDIARQLIEDEPGKSIRVIMGGGRQCLTSNWSNSDDDPLDTWACQRRDGRDLFTTWRTHKEALSARYVEVRNTAGLRAIDPATTDFLLGVFANGHMKYEHERDTSDLGTPSLAEMTRTALHILQRQQRNGYVLIVESGLIDIAHHRGTAKRALNEVLVLEDAVKEAINFTNPDDTLILVTADHTNTLSFSGYPRRGNDIMGVAEKSPMDQRGYTTLSYATGTATKYSVDSTSHVVRADATLEDTTSFTYQQHAAVPHIEQTHGGADVTLFATGPMAHLFHSVHEQNYVAHAVAYAMKIGPFETSKSTTAIPSLEWFIVLLTSFYIQFYWYNRFNKCHFT